jgi:uridine phosphorylase
LDGASLDYAPIEYPAVADYDILTSLVSSARELKIPFHVGVTASTDTFYAGQGRRFSRYMIQRLNGSMEAWQKLGVLSYEMEASTLLTFCRVHGLKGGCITGVAVNRLEEQMVREELLDVAEQRAISVATKAMEKLVVSFKEL